MGHRDKSSVESNAWDKIHINQTYEHALVCEYRLCHTEVQDIFITRVNSSFKSCLKVFVLILKNSSTKCLKYGIRTEHWYGRLAVCRPGQRVESGISRKIINRPSPLSFLTKPIYSGIKIST